MVRHGSAAAALARLCAKCYAESMDILSLVDRGDLDLIRQRIFGATAAELNAASIKKRITPLHRAVAMNRILSTPAATLRSIVT